MQRSQSRKIGFDVNVITFLLIAFAAIQYSFGNKIIVVSLPMKANEGCNGINLIAMERKRMEIETEQSRENIKNQLNKRFWHNHIFHNSTLN